MAKYSNFVPSRCFAVCDGTGSGTRETEDEVGNPLTKTGDCNDGGNPRLDYGLSVFLGKSLYFVRLKHVLYKN